MDKELIKKVHEMVGAIKMAKVTGGLIDSARYSLIKQLRDSKAYKALGKDWKEFCSDELGSNQNTINQEIKLLEEYGESFLKSAERVGLQKRDLFALGSGLPEDAKSGIKKGVIKIGDVEIKESEIEERADELKDAIASLAKAYDETKSGLKAQTRITDDFRKNNERLQKTLDRLEKREAHLAENPSAFEDDYMKTLDGFKLGFDKFMDRIDPESTGVRELFSDEDEDGKKKKFCATAKMTAHYLATLDYMKKRVTAACGIAQDNYGTPEMFPEGV